MGTFDSSGAFMPMKVLRMIFLLLLRYCFNIYLLRLLHFFGLYLVSEEWQGDNPGGV